MDTKQDALEFFCKATSFLYREIGVLITRNHPELASKARLQGDFFKGGRKKIAKEVYHKTKTEEDTHRILESYEYRTGLTLEDIHRIFSEGHWRNSSGGYSFGGPKWAEIARTVIELRQLIDAKDWDKMPDFLTCAKKLRHNNGQLTEKFKEFER